MDTARGRDEVCQDNDPLGAAASESGVGDVETSFGSDERRMQVRAYNHWVSLLRNRPYPAIGDLDPASIADFGGNSVLLDFTAGLENPAIPFIGRALREECGVSASVKRINDVPARSLLSRLTDHYLKIIAKCAPVGFEAEFIGLRGHETLYRGVLMPFSSDGETIDFIYGVINWKERVAAPEQRRLDEEVAAALRAPAPQLRSPAGVWADGPGVRPVPAGVDALAERLMLARESAEGARAAAARSRAALHRALGRAHDLILSAGGQAESLQPLLTGEGARRRRNVAVAAAELVFDREPEGAKFSDIAAVLSYAARRGVPEGGLARLLEETPGGVPALATRERSERRAARG